MLRSVDCHVYALRKYGENQFNNQLWISFCYELFCWTGDCDVISAYVLLLYMKSQRPLTVGKMPVSAFVLLEWVVFYMWCFTFGHKLFDLYWSKTSKSKNAFPWSKHKKPLHKKTPDRSRIQNDKMNWNYLNHPQQRPLQAAVWNGALGLGLAWLMLANTQWKSQKTQHSDQFLCLQKPKPANIRFLSRQQNPIMADLSLSQHC